MIKKSIKRVLGHPWVTFATRSLSRGSLVVLCYHRIRRRNEPQWLADSLFGPDADGFERQVRWLAHNMHPVSEAEILECFRARKPMPDHSVLVTFDDGYRDNLEIAAPILKAHSVPALYFIPTGLITQRKTGWWDEIAWLIKSTRGGALQAAGQSAQLPASDPAQTIEFLNRHCKALGTGERMRTFVSELERQCGVGPMPGEAADSALMTWEQIRLLKGYGIDVGAHTVSHPVLSRLGIEQQRQELAASKAELEKNTGRPVSSFAFPFGEKDDFGPETKRLAQEAGFELGFSLIAGTNRIGTADAMELNRILGPVEESTFKVRLTLASLAPQRAPAYQPGERALSCAPTVSKP